MNPGKWCVWFNRRFSALGQVRIEASRVLAGGDIHRGRPGRLDRPVAQALNSKASITVINGLTIILLR